MKSVCITRASLQPKVMQPLNIYEVYIKKAKNRAVMQTLILSHPINRRIKRNG